VKEKESHHQKWLAMEADLKMSEEKALQLKENEEILIQQIQRLKNELLEFQAMFLKSHNVSLNKSLIHSTGSNKAFTDKFIYITSFSRSRWKSGSSPNHSRADHTDDDLSRSGKRREEEIQDRETES